MVGLGWSRYVFICFIEECIFFDEPVYLFFFFQAEDGIRDKLVTGVQTCALPISERTNRRAARSGQVESCAQLELVFDRMRVETATDALPSRGVDVDILSGKAQPIVRKEVDRGGEGMAVLAHRDAGAGAAFVGGKDVHPSGQPPGLVDGPAREQIRRLEPRAAPERLARVEVGLASHALREQRDRPDLRAEPDVPKLGLPGFCVVLFTFRGRLGLVVVV